MIKLKQFNLNVDLYAMTFVISEQRCSFFIHNFTLRIEASILNTV